MEDEWRTSGRRAETKRHCESVMVEPNQVELPAAKFVRAVIADPDRNEFLISNRTD